MVFRRWCPPTSEATHTLSPGSCEAACSTAARRVLCTAMDNGAADQVQLDRGFIVAMPYGDTPRTRTRAPFSDDVSPRPGRRGEPAPAGRLGHQRSRAARHLGNHRGHRTPWRRGSQPQTGLPRPLRRVADAMARPDQGRQLRPGHPDPRNRLPAPAVPPTTNAPGLQPPPRTAAHTARADSHGPVSHDPQEPARPDPDSPTPGSRACSAVDHRARPGPLCSAPGQAFPGHQFATSRRHRQPRPPIPRARFRPDGRALHPCRRLRD